MDKELITPVLIESKIFVIPDKQVMIDRDLADLYGVETKRITEAVKRNIERFPEDFRFQFNIAAIINSSQSSALRWLPPLWK